MRYSATENHLKGMTYGVELEYEGITLQRAAKAIADTVGGTAVYRGTHLSNWEIAMPDGRKWQVETDGSLNGGAESVSPVCTIEDMPMVQAVVRALRDAGAKANVRTGLHVHVGAANMTAAQIKHLVKIWYKNEKLITSMLGTDERRLNRYCRETDRAFVERICAMANPTMAAIGDAYYGNAPDRNYHYCSCRYRTLNLHNLWNGVKHTVEFRAFNGTTHAGEVRTAITLALLAVRKAMTAKNSSAENRRRVETSVRYDARVFLLNLGMIGDYTANCRKHLLKRLAGSCAWKHGRQAA